MKTLLVGNTKCHAATRLREEFTKRGLQFDAVSPSDVIFSVADNHTSITTNSGRDIYDYDVYLFRGLGKRAREMAVIANYLRNQNKVIVEDVFATRAAYFDKFSPTMVDDGIPVIDYKLIFSSNGNILDTVEFPIIAKSLEGSMGIRVRLLRTRAELNEFIEKFDFPILLQKYIPITFDYRVIVVDGVALGVMKRYNEGEDFLTVRSGGRRECVELPPHALELATHCARVAGLSVAGVDILEHEGEYYRIEVNMSPQFRTFERVTECNVAGAICEMLQRKYQEQQLMPVTNQYTDPHASFVAEQ